MKPRVFTLIRMTALGERHRQYLILSPSVTGKLCDTSLPDDFVINLECSPLVDESRTSSEKGSLSTAHGSYAILLGLSMLATTILTQGGLLRPKSGHCTYQCKLWNQEYLLWSEWHLLKLVMPCLTRHPGIFMYNKSAIHERQQWHALATYGFRVSTTLRPEWRIILGFGLK